ncbi:MAG: hypothetical protein JKY32_05540 [Rhizobiales bacterium]|nr:hypothetical protein [Hyphomicrobiales bacterium]
MSYDQGDTRNYSENYQAFWEGCLDRLQALFENNPPLKKQSSSVGDGLDNTHKENKQ